MSARSRLRSAGSCSSSRGISCNRRARRFSRFSMADGRRAFCAKAAHSTRIARNPFAACARFTLGIPKPGGNVMKIPKLACAALLAAFSAGAAAVGGLADLTVYDRSEGRSLPVYWHEGRAWVVGKPGNEYRCACATARARTCSAVHVGRRRQRDHRRDRRRRSKAATCSRPAPPVRHQRLAQEPGLAPRRSTSRRCRIPMPRAPGAPTTSA